MTSADLLRDMYAAHAARRAYQAAAERMAQEALVMLHDGYPELARQLALFANIAQRAARNEYDEGQVA